MRVIVAKECANSECKMAAKLTRGQRGCRFYGTYK